MEIEIPSLLEEVDNLIKSSLYDSAEALLTLYISSHSSDTTTELFKVYEKIGDIYLNYDSLIILKLLTYKDSESEKLGSWRRANYFYQKAWQILKGGMISGKF